MKTLSTILVAACLSASALPATVYAQANPPGPLESMGQRDAGVAPANTTTDSGSASTGSSTVAGSKVAITDSAITTKVKSRIAASKGLKSMDIHVTTESGVVTLTGSVDTASQVALASRLAHKTKGVAKVDNQLETKTS